MVEVGDDFTREFPDGDATAASLFATLIRTGQAFDAELDRVMLASFGVPQPVLRSLAVIEGAHEPLTPTQISERVLISSATMTGVLDALEDLGWVRRLPNPDDRRSVLIEITDAGQTVADRFLPGVRKLERALLDGMGNGEMATMMKLLAKILGQAASVAAADPIPLEGRRDRSR